MSNFEPVRGTLEWGETQDQDQDQGPTILGCSITDLHLFVPFSRMTLLNQKVLHIVNTDNQQY